jgi:hypothetical protein
MTPRNTEHTKYNLPGTQVSDDALAQKYLLYVEKRPFSLAALPISLYRDIPKPNIDLHGRVDTAGLPRAD